MFRVKKILHIFQTCKTMHTQIVDVNGLPTKVRTWGNTLKDTPKENSHYIIFIPGNPGLIDIYIDFLEEIHKRTDLTIWSIAHVGHDHFDSYDLPPSEGNEHLYNLQAQIQHKISFLETYLPTDVKIIFLGHSMGTYIILKLLQVTSIKDRVVKNYLLFPTIENLAETQNGQLVLNRLQHFWFIISLMARFFQILPVFVQNFMLNIFCKSRDIPHHYSELFRDFINPFVLRNFGVLGLDSTLTVKERDNETLRNNIDKIKLYYGVNDFWTPVSFYEKLKTEIPNIDAELCNKGYPHSFVLQHSIPMAEMVIEWMKMK